MKIFRLFIIILFLMNSTMLLANGQGNTMTLSKERVLAGADVTVTLEIENEDAFAGFQLEIPLPDDFVFQSFTLNPDRINGHTPIVNYDQDTNILQLFSANFGGSQNFIGNEGPVGYIEIQTPETPGFFDLPLNNPGLSDLDGQPLLGVNAEYGEVELVGNEMSIVDTSVIIDQTVQIELKIENYQDFVGFQTEIELPDEFVYVGNEQLYRGNNHTLTITEQPGNKLVIVAFRIGGNAYFDDFNDNWEDDEVSSGLVVVSFDVVAPSQGDTYTMTPENALMSDFDGNPLVVTEISGEITVFGDNQMFVQDAVGATNQTITLNLEIDNSDLFYGFQAHIDLADLEFVPNSVTELRVLEGIHSITGNLGPDGQLIIVGLSQPTTAFPGFGGAVASFDVVLPNDPGMFELEIDSDNSFISSALGQPIGFTPSTGTVIVELENELALVDTEACSGHEFPVYLELNNNQAIAAFQADVHIPEGFEFVSAELNTERAPDHIIFNPQAPGDDNILKLVVFAQPSTNFLDADEDWLVKIYLEAPFWEEGDDIDYDITLSDTKFSDIDGEDVFVSAEIDGVITLHQEPAIGFSFLDTVTNDYVLVDTDDVLTYCFNETVSVTLSDIWGGNAPFNIEWEVTTDDGVFEGEISAYGVELGGEVFNGIQEPGTYVIEVTSIVDANGCSPVDLSPYTLTVIIYDDITYTEPEDLTVYSCELITQDTVETAFNNWLDSALNDLAGGEAVTFTYTYDDEIPVLCEGGEVEVTWTILDSCGSFFETAKFILIEPEPVLIDTPDDQEYNACDFADQDALDSVFANWLAEFSVSGGCDAELPVLSMYEAPPLCDGGIITISFTVDDPCEPITVHTTFMVNAPAPLIVNVPENDVFNACDFADQEDLNTAFSNWLNSFSVSGGCGADLPDLSSYEAPNLCQGGVVTIAFSVNDLCDTVEVSKTFQLNPVPELSVTAPESVELDACTFEDQDEVDVVFAYWIEGFTVTGGCNIIIDLDQFEAPNLCLGGKVVVAFNIDNIDDHICYEEMPPVSATFKLIAPDPITYNAPVDSNLDVNTFASQQEINDAFDAWFYAQNTAVTSTLNGGCDPVVTNNSELADIPGICQGGSAEVTWTITDLCQTIELTASFNVSQPDEPLLVFAINGQPIAQNHIENVIFGEAVEVSVYEAWAGQYPFTISWTINGDADHDFAGTDVVITEAGQILFPLNDEDIPLGEYVIEVTSLVDANGCASENLDLYVATIIVEPIILTIDGSFTVFNKLVDGSQDATINEDNIILAGVNPAYPVSLVKVAEFVNAEVGNNKEVNLLASYLEGASADAYVLSFDDAPTTTANILPVVHPVIIYADGSYPEPDPEFFEGTVKTYQIEAVIPGFEYSWEISPEANVIVSEVNNTIIIEWNETGTLTLRATVAGSNPDDPDVLEASLDVSVIQIALSGTVKYNRNNGNHTPISGVKVKLTPVNGGASIERITGASGFYQFLTIPDGEYIVEVSTQIPWGGVNASDALAVQRRGINLFPPFYHEDNFDFAFRDKVGDVRERGQAPNAGDAFKIQQRAIQLITEFPAGDWAFTVMPVEGAIEPEMFFGNTEASVATKTFNTETDCRVMNILAMTYGDVNASYNWSSSAKNSFPVQGGGDIILKKGDAIQVPVILKSSITVGSASIFIEYDERLVKVNGLQTDIPDMLYNITDNHVNVSWADINGLRLPDDNTLFILELAAKQDVMVHDEPFYIDNRTEFTDTFGTVLHDAYILMDADVITGIIDDVYAKSMFSIACHPNPVNDLLTIEYKLPEHANVELTLVGHQGQIVSNVLSEKQYSGQHTVQFDLRRYNLKEGLYFVRIIAVGDNYAFNETVRIVVIN